MEFILVENSLRNIKTIAYMDKVKGGYKITQTDGKLIHISDKAGQAVTKELLRFKQCQQINENRIINFAEVEEITASNIHFSGTSLHLTKEESEDMKNAMLRIEEAANNEEEEEETAEQAKNNIPEEKPEEQQQATKKETTAKTAAKTTPKTKKDNK